MFGKEIACVSSMAFHVVFQRLPRVLRPVARLPGGVRPSQSPVGDDEMFEIVFSDGHGLVV
jgi:hypothetical protein